MEGNLAEFSDWKRPDGGFFIGSFVKQSVQADVLMLHALKHGLKLTDGRGFYTQGGDQFVRLPFCALEDAQIENGICRLAETLMKGIRRKPSARRPPQTAQQECSRRRRRWAPRR